MVSAIRLMRQRLGQEGILRTLATGSASSFVVSVSGAAIGVVLHGLLARRLGQEGYGTYVYLFGWMNIALLLAVMELDTCAVRFVSSYLATRDPGRVRGFTRWSLRASATSSLTIGASGIVGLYLVRDHFSANTYASALLACMILPLWSVALVSSGCLAGFKQILRSQAPLNLVRPVLVLLGVVIVLAAARSAFTSASVIGISVAAGTVALALSGRWLVVELRAVPDESPATDTPLWWRTVFGLLPGSIAQRVLGVGTDVVIVGSMLDVRHAAAYSLATQLIILIALVINAMSSIAAPMIADYHARADEAGLRRLLRIIGRVNILLVAPLALLIAFAGFRVLAWFGPGYAEAYPALLWLLGACLTATLGGHATLMLTMTGRQHAASVIIGASAVGNLLLSFVLTAKFGVTGTAAATAIAICLRNGALCYWVKRDVGMSVWPW